MRHLILASGLIGFTLLAAGCQMTPAPAPAPVPLPTPVPPTPAPGTCNAAPVQGAVGQPASASVLEQVTLGSGASRARVLHPGDVVTMEFAADRLTVSVDAGNRIISLNCG